MPSFAYVKQDINCPYCNFAVHNLTAFQWGFCPGYNVQEKYIYKLNDSIYWKTCKDGSKPAWTYFDERQGNIGDPSILNLIVRDSSHYWQYPLSCRNCQRLLGGAVVKIIEGNIARVWVYEPGELDNQIDIYLIIGDGSLKPMMEWNDHPMMRLKDC